MSLAPLEARINGIVEQISMLVEKKEFKDSLKKAVGKKVNYPTALVDWELAFFAQDLSVQDQESRDRIAILIAELKSDLTTARKRSELHLGTDESEAAE